MSGEDRTANRSVTVPSEVRRSEVEIRLYKRERERPPNNGDVKQMVGASARDSCACGLRFRDRAETASCRTALVGFIVRGPDLTSH